MSTTPPPASGDSPQAMKERLSRLEQDLNRQRQRVDGSTTLTAIVGIIALIAVAGYSYYGYTAIADAVKPDKVVSLAEVTLDENLPQLRRRLEAEIVQSAPEWANTLSKEALGALPVARKRLEKVATDYADEALQETHAITDKRFREFYKTHHDDLQKKFDELAKSPNLAETSIADIQADLEKDLQVDLKADATVLLKEITQRNQNFKQLRDGKNLTPEAQIERKAWMLVKALGKEGLDLSSTGLPDISANGGITKTGSSKPIASDGRTAKPGKKPPIAGAQEDNKKDAAKPQEKKDSTPDAVKKDAEKKEKKEDKKKD
ncbi:MAG TPA: hypothetical protein VGX70_23335 [Gemmataceae bacterium]|nr:hypothetical protein [Gemmataceae bacterium]